MIAAAFHAKNQGSKVERFPNERMSTVTGEDPQEMLELRQMNATALHVDGLDQT